jgi:cell division protein FtsB
MDCDQVQSELLAADDIDAPDGVFARFEQQVAGCVPCSQLVRKLRRLNATVRSLPEPINTRAAQLRFQHNFADKLKLTAKPMRMRRMVLMPSRLVALAAMILLSLGIGAWAYVDHENRVAVSALAIQKAVDWNLNLSQSDSNNERQVLYAKGAEDLQQASVSAEDRPIADHLLQGGKFLADNHDPVAQADHFTQVAGLLVSRMDRAAHKNPKALQPLGESYLDVMDRGIHRNLDIAAVSASPETLRRIERIIQRNLQLQVQLQAMLRDRPDAAGVRQKLENVERRLHKLQQQAKAATQPGAATSSPLDSHQIH